MNPVSLQIYDYAMAAGGSFQLPVQGSYFRILSTTGNVSVIGDTFGKLGPINRGQGLENRQYGRLTIKDESGAPNAGTILVSDANFIDQTLYGSISLASAIALDAATLAALENVKVTPDQKTSNWSSSGALALGTPQTIFTPAANTNGAIVLAAGFSLVGNAALGNPSILAKSSAPTTNVDGDLILTPQSMSAASYLEAAALPIPQYINAGDGLYFILGGPISAGARYCRFKLL